VEGKGTRYLEASVADELDPVAAPDGHDLQRVVAGKAPLWEWDTAEAAARTAAWEARRGAQRKGRREVKQPYAVNTGIC
jgi:hypothetical protein